MKDGQQQWVQARPRGADHGVANGDASESQSEVFRPSFQHRAVFSEWRSRLLGHRYTGQVTNYNPKQGCDSAGQLGMKFALQAKIM